MKLALLTMLPVLYWDRAPDTAAELKQAGVDRVYVPAARKDAWSGAGVEATAVDVAKLTKLTKPGVQYRMNQAAATSVPWIDANGWKLARDPKRTYYYDVSPETVAIAMAESYSRDAAVVIHGDLASFGRMLAFLKRIDQPAMPAVANIGLIDDGSDITGEAMNLLARRNLLLRVVKSPDPKLDLNLKPTAKEAADPFAYAKDVRQKLGDDKRLVRLYGSEVVLANLTGDGAKARLYLINYSNRKVTGLRVLVRGAYAKAVLSAFGVDNAATADLQTDGGATEFTVPEMGAFAVVDLSGAGNFAR
jgi:hypothetical protein